MLTWGRWCRVIDGDLENPPVVLGDGTPVEMFNVTALTNPEDDPQLGMSRSYLYYMEEGYNNTINSEYKLLIFHYTTRSLQVGSWSTRISETVHPNFVYGNWYC